MSHLIEVIASALFALALAHTFLVNIFQRLAHRYPKSSLQENFFHLLGEIEIVFGLWGAIFIVIMMALEGPHTAISYLESLDFREASFVFVVMALCATKPIHDFAVLCISALGRLLPINTTLSFFFMILSIGPILGSLITEPAAMTLCALMLKEHFYDHKISRQLKYATLAVLFVNVSIGGTLTHFAAPPILMVAAKWNWDLGFLFTHFGWKATIAVFVNTIGLSLAFRKELITIGKNSPQNLHLGTKNISPAWLIAIHIIFLTLVVASVHHSVVFLGLFLLFLGLISVTREFQRDLALKNALLVAFFLAGLVVLGTPQGWWLKPLLMQLQSTALFLGATALTAITDNAAITFLAAQSGSLSDASKYSVVAGAVTGGGLTIIANAPNPAAFGILKENFGSEGLNPISLFLYALLPTLVAGICFYFLPSLGVS